MTYEEFKRMQAEKKPKRTVSHPEDDLQKECVGWFRDCFPELSPLLFHPNNEAFFGKGRSREQQEKAGKRAKDMGVVPGVADLILLYASPPFNGLCIEMKTRIGKQSKSQVIWQKVVERYGYRYEVIRTKECFKTLIKSYLMREPRSENEILLDKLAGKKRKTRQT